jgi:hypothetical protein
MIMPRSQQEPTPVPSANQTRGEASYDVASLRRHYGIGRHEAERLLEKFGDSKQELDMLLSGKGRTSSHRLRELATPDSKAAFGIG